MSIIDLALQENFSTNCEPHNKGLGLFNTKKFIESCEGKMTVSVKDGAYITSITDRFSSNIDIEHLKTYNGTKVELKIPINNLPLLDCNEER